MIYSCRASNCDSDYTVTDCSVETFVTRVLPVVTMETNKVKQKLNVSDSYSNSNNSNNANIYASVSSQHSHCSCLLSFSVLAVPANQ